MVLIQDCCLLEKIVAGLAIYSLVSIQRCYFELVGGVDILDHTWLTRE